MGGWVSELVRPSVEKELEQLFFGFVAILKYASQGTLWGYKLSVFNELS